MYEKFSLKQKRMILVAGAFLSSLTPFTDTIYLPCLETVRKELQTSETLTSLSVSIYLAAVGVGQMLWGPLSDRFGRLKILFICLIVYEAITISCIFPKSIGALIVERTIQGFFVGTAIVSVQAIISDVYAPEKRGGAMAAFLGPMLLAPIIAPLIGGVLSQHYGWRSTFMLLAALNGPILLVTRIFVPETHPWYALGKNNNICASDRESKTIPIEQTHAKPPKFVPPWFSLGYIFEKELAPYYFSGSLTFSSMFTSLTLLPFALANSPYLLNDTIIGICYLPVGIAMLLGSMFGGMLSDFCAHKFPLARDGMMAYPMLLSIFNCVGCVGFGYTLQFGVNLSGPLISQCLIGFGNAIIMPASMGFFSTAKQENAAAANAVFMFLCFVFAAICISFAPLISSAIGFQNLFWILFCLCFVSCGWACHNCYRNIFQRKPVGTEPSQNI